MSDFISTGWALFEAAIAIWAIVYCVGLLVLNNRMRPHTDTDGTTGHVWDETLQEFNNPLPRWWVGLYIITIVFGVLYFVLYPSVGTYQGVLNWSSAGQLEKEQAAAKEAEAKIYAPFAAMSAEDLAKNQQAMGIGQRLFLNNCAVCHGSDAKGTKGFPNLTDDDWLYGGEHDAIIETIANGRVGAMPPMKDAVGTPEDVKNLANFVLSLSGSPHDAARAAQGKPKFESAGCTGCHGADGKGMQALGAPNLTDKIWLHGFGEAAIIERINNGKTNQMPAWSYKFSKDQIRVLSAYIWSLSHKAPAASKT
jgi:cytochrome c oxidase cbb3-type subunit III